jgi:hypothetical protein
MKPWQVAVLCVSMACLSGLVVIFIVERHDDGVLSGIQAQLGELRDRAPLPSDEAPGDPRLAAMRLAQAQLALAAPVTAESASSPAPQPLKEQHMPAPTMSEVRDFYESTWAAEPADAKWAVSATKLARARLDSLLPSGSTLDTLECKTSMCRFETSHADRSQYQSFVDSALRDPQTHIWNGGFMFAVESDQSGSGGPIKIVSFLARDGEELPRFMQ